MKGVCRNALNGSNALNGRFCNKLSCTFEAKCGYALCESPALRISRNTNTGMRGITVAADMPAGDIIWARATLSGPLVTPAFLAMTIACASRHKSQRTRAGGTLRMMNHWPAPPYDRDALSSQPSAPAWPSQPRLTVHQYILTRAGPQNVSTRCKLPLQYEMLIIETRSRCPTVTNCDVSIAVVGPNGSIDTYNGDEEKNSDGKSDGGVVTGSPTRGATPIGHNDTSAVVTITFAKSTQEPATRSTPTSTRLSSRLLVTQ
ncbi:hypothetical protein GN244_ATG16246 [Phytophthora infestans]|uniref:Uncharacterized protein n=1 Tax=Phytophthora infestans TaxID=4787 RepID=A0A833T120_PHYIN|nr:hypothetical protein GN244_ATG16246 [Phytophthora infestans]